MEDKIIEERLSKEMEGGLYAYIYVTPNIEALQFLVGKLYYTVIGGKVCQIKANKGVYSTGDTLLKLKTNCRRIGRYDPEKEYKPKHAALSYSEIQKRLFK